MAWGRSGGSSAGLDDLCARLRANDPKLQSLTLLKHRKVDEAELRKLCASLQHNTVLKELYASNHAISPAAAALVSELLCNNSTLTALCIGNSSFGDAGLAALSTGLCSSSSLRSLDLEHKNVGEAGAATLAQVLSQSVSLQQLSLARNPLGNAGAAALCQQPWQALDQLDLSTCDLGPAGILSLANQHAGSRLVCLNLSHNNLTGPEAGSSLRQLLCSYGALKQLKLRSCQLTDGSIEALAGVLAQHPALDLLDLQDNGCAEHGGAALAAAFGNGARLRHLDLGRNQGVSAGSVQQLARAISGQGEMTVLRHLDLSGVNLQGDCDGTIKALAPCSLHTLCLLGTSLSNQGAQAFVDCLDQGGFAALQELSLSACDLELETGLGLLLNALLDNKAPSLQVLECGANPACQDDKLMPLLLQLREARPGLQVHWSAMDDAAKVEVMAGGGAPVA